MPVFGADTITDLWHANLLRADLVTSDRKIEMPDLDPVSQENGLYLYCDGRQVEHRASGYGGILSNLAPVSEGLELHFHPFRLYVLYHVDRVFDLKIASHQYLLNPGGFANLTNREIEGLDRWTSSVGCSERFEHWNRTAELAILLEPVAYESVFQVIRWRFPDTEESLREGLELQRGKVMELLSTLGVAQIGEIRGELCRDGEILDGNKLLHVLLRLMPRHERLKIKGSLGGCMLFLCMAEVIRRAAEQAFDEDLPEEDEMGFGQWMAGARKSIYGTERILDAPRETRRDFLTSMGLDYGVKVRCYVEGDTEIGALTSAVGEWGGMEFINLRGQVLERFGKGLSFVASLKNDKKSHAFSVVVLDGDRQDYIRALKKAAKDDKFFGRFFISTPDFEFGNFTVGEPVDVALTLAAQDREAVLPARDKIIFLVAAATSGKQFFDSLEGTRLQKIGKGEGWGVALMNYALQHPEFPTDHEMVGAVRPCIEIARLLVRCRNAGYLRTLANYRVDPETGELRDK